MREMYFENLNRGQLANLHDAIVLIPVGATEQHGPHLATGADFKIVNSIARDVSMRIKDQLPIVVAPTVQFGFSKHHLPFGATITLAPDTFQSLLIDISESLIKSGFRKLFIINGHGGNNELIAVVAREISLNHDVRMGAGSYWTMAWKELVAKGAHRENRLPGHAGSFETSLMLFLDPTLVSPNRPTRNGDFSSNETSFYPEFMSEDQRSWLKIDGYSESPVRASAEQGRIWYEAILDGVIRNLKDFASVER